MSASNRRITELPHAADEITATDSDSHDTCVIAAQHRGLRHKIFAGSIRLTRRVINCDCPTNAIWRCDASASLRFKAQSGDFGQLARLRHTKNTTPINGSRPCTRRNAFSFLTRLCRSAPPPLSPSPKISDCGRRRRRTRRRAAFSRRRETESIDWSALNWDPSRLVRLEREYHARKNRCRPPGRARSASTRTRRNQPGSVGAPIDPDSLLPGARRGARPTPPGRT